MGRSRNTYGDLDSLRRHWQHLKDQRLLFYLGDSYATYMQNVPGYPMMLGGPLGKRRASHNVSEPDSKQRDTIPFQVDVRSDVRRAG